MTRLAATAALCMVALSLSGCWVGRFLGLDDPGTAPAQSHAGAVLASLGSMLVWAGGIAAAVGIAAVVLLATPWGRILALVPGIDGIGKALLSAGLAIVTLGTALVYLSENLWILLLATLGTLACWAWLHRRGVRRWLVRMGAIASAPPFMKDHG